MVKSYSKKSSELRVCANSSSVTQSGIAVALRATWTNAPNKREASNPQRLSSGTQHWLSNVGFCTKSAALQFNDVPEQGR